MEITIHRYGTIDSTNSEAKRYGLSGGAIPAVFVAREQTAGRGRMGRSFYSPNGTGLYYSMLLPLPEKTDHAVSLTAAAAVAAAEAISRVLGCEVGIKWVNDLYRDGKKVAGILCESFPYEDKRLAVIGIGINLSTQQFPEELAEVAASLFGTDQAAMDEEQKERLIEELTHRLLAAAQQPNAPELMARYRARSTVLGKPIRFLQNGVEQEGIAEAITDTGALSVRLNDGSERLLQSGEITLRLQETEKESNRR